MLHISRFCHFQSRHCFQSRQCFKSNWHCVEQLIAFKAMQTALRIWHGMMLQCVMIVSILAASAKRFTGKTANIASSLLFFTLSKAEYPTADHVWRNAGSPGNNNLSVVAGDKPDTELPATLPHITTRILSCSALIRTAVRKTADVLHFTRRSLHENNELQSCSIQFETMEMQYNQKFAVQTAIFAQEELC